MLLLLFTAEALTHNSRATAAAGFPSGRSCTGACLGRCGFGCEWFFHLDCFNRRACLSNEIPPRPHNMFPRRKGRCSPSLAQEIMAAPGCREADLRYPGSMDIGRHTRTPKGRTTIIAAYLPPSAQDSATARTAWAELQGYIIKQRSKQNKLVILAGDLNASLCDLLHRKNTENSHHRAQGRLLSNLMEATGLTDSFPHCLPDKKYNTWKTMTHGAPWTTYCTSRIHHMTLLPAVPLTLTHNSWALTTLARAKGPKSA
jgi:hypothetical protein